MRFTDNIEGPTKECCVNFAVDGIVFAKGFKVIKDNNTQFDPKDYSDVFMASMSGLKLHQAQAIITLMSGDLRRLVDKIVLD